MDSSQPRLDRWVGAATAALARHWLWAVGLAIAIFVGLPVAAPVLAQHGYGQAAGWIYLVYRIACHQLPQRSFFIGGKALTYDWPTVQPYTGLPLDNPYLAFHHPLGNPVLGYQLALCERDMAIWLALLATAMWYGWYRARRERGGRGLTAPLPFQLYALAMVPIALDGLTQLVGWRESTPLLRVVTGGLFGMATGLLVLPHLELAFREMAQAE